MDVLICPNCWRTNEKRVEGVDVDPLPEHATRWVQCPDCATTLLYWDNRGQLDIGIVRSDADRAANNLTVFLEEFDCLIRPAAAPPLETPRRSIKLVPPLSFGGLLAETRAVLARVIDVEPMYEHGCGDVTCFWCDADQTPYPAWDKQREPVEHAADCAWAAAHRAIGQRLPAGHSRKDPS